MFDRYMHQVTDNEAYGGKVTLSVGIGNDQTVYGISYLSLNETPGLGMRAKEEAFTNQFKNKKVDYFKYSKSGASSDNEIDALSGATITSKNISFISFAILKVISLFTTTIPPNIDVLSALNAFFQAV